MRVVAFSMECIFCDIANGKAPANVCMQTDDFVAFEDIFPKAQTHIIVIPKEHYKDLDDWVKRSKSNDNMMNFVHETANKLGVTGKYRLVTNVGSGAGQVVFHLHWHILAGDDLPGF